MKEQFLDSLEFFKDLFDNAHDLIHIVSLDGTLLYVNNAWLRLLEYSLEEITGNSIYSYLDEPDRSHFHQYRNDIIEGKYQKELVIKFISKSVKKLDLEGFVSVKIIDGQPQYTRGIFRDITSKLENEARLKSMNEELKEREANLQQLLDHAPDAVIVANSQSIINYWNPKATEIFGWTADEVVGNSLTEIIIPPQFRKAHLEGMKRFLTTGEARVLNKTIEISALRKEGDEFFVSLTISNLNQHGEVVFIAIIRDIDRQKINALELEEKKKELEISNQELEQFAHVASHDMKEPIRKIRMYSDQLKMDTATQLSSAGNNYLSKIENAATRLTNMIEGVLNYSVLKSGDLFSENVDLNEVVDSVSDDLELIIIEKKAVIKYHELPKIEGANFLLYQLLYNLISNSLKFSKPSIPPFITITADKLSEEELVSLGVNKSLAYVKLILDDNGIGFDQEYAENIFKTFFRLHSNHTIEGTGLGLALCKNIVDKHHGLIYAEGKEGVGARFTIVLPAKQL